DFDAVLALKPDWDAALVQRAKLKAKSGDWEAAIEDYKSAGKKYEDDITAVKEAKKAVGAAEKAEDNKNYALCAAEATKAIEVAGGVLSLRLLRARCRMNNGDVREA